MRLKFIGAAHEVTGSCHYLKIGDKNILVDCGMEQGPDIYENQEIPVNANRIDYVFVTHAHIDHSGLIPLLSVRGFKGKVYATNATTQLCNIMLRDSAHIQESEAEWKNRKAQRSGGVTVEPMYKVEDVENVMRRFVPCPYGQKIEVCPELTVCFHDAGHLLGSSFIEMWAKEGDEEKKLVFSGDLGNGKRALIRDPEPLPEADYLIVESTYGDRNHEVQPGFDYAATLADVIARTFKRGGNVVIPAFSVGRTQEMLYYLRRIKTENMVPSFADFEVYVDSPLSVEATTVFNKNVMECFREEAKAEIRDGVNPISFDGLKTSVSSEDSKMINAIKHPVVIISASGMCEAGRIRHHLKHNLWRPESTIVFVGYQVPGTLGRHLLEGADEVKLFGETISVQAEVLNLPGISGHADCDHLTAWVKSAPVQPRHIFVVHGEDQVTDSFAAHLEQETGTPASAPYSGDAFDLIANEYSEYAEVRHAEKKKVTKETQKKNSVYARLLAAAERLLEVVHKNKEGANKDLARFASQIESLCSKWDR